VAHRRLNSALVAVQFALSLVLLIGAGLLLKSFQRLESVDLGFNPENTLTMVATLPQSKYDNEEKALRFYESAMERLRCPCVAGNCSAGGLGWRYSQSRSPLLASIAWITSFGFPRYMMPL